MLTLIQYKQVLMVGVAVLKIKVSGNLATGDLTSCQQKQRSPKL
jgi:hypothetical protein